MHIGHQMFWVNATNRSPDINTKISMQDYLDGIWKPKMENMTVRIYVFML